MLKKLGRWMLGSSLLVGLAALGGYVWLRQSLPQTAGTLHLQGLHGAVTVERDADGIPTIRADDEHDGYYALGFVHAQDRLWQMESQRRAGAGRLAEVAGASAQPLDRFMRTLGIYRLAEQNLARLSPEVIAAIEAYTAGVNSFLATNPVLPPEFIALRYRPEPWRAVDSIIWGRLMALQLSGNWREELQRLRSARMVSPEMLADLQAPAPKNGPTTLGQADGVVDRLLAEMPEEIRPRLASNVWVVDGAHSASGKPVLANDPHLGFQAPVLWYLARLEMPGLPLAGATVPGVPFHLLGQNGKIAWGITTTHSDTMDLFVEIPTSADTYLTPDGPARYAVRTEEIRVKDGVTETLRIRSTRHGPVINDALADPPPTDAPLALSAAALREDDLTAQAIYRLNRAGDWAGFVEALRDFHSPQQNIAYADTTGAIGFLSPGRLPIRASGDGSMPTAGADGRSDWVGWVPFDALPRLAAPASGRIVNANNKVVPDGYPYLLAASWPDGYRARRIDELLDSRPRLDADGAALMQADAFSPLAAEFLPTLLAAPVSSERGVRALQLLRGWNGAMERDRPEPAIFEAWLLQLQARLVNPKLGPAARFYSWPRPGFLHIALSGQNGWCGTRCPQLMAESLDAALDHLSARLGKKIESWRWGDLHQARFEHGIFRHVPLLDRWAGLNIATDGDDFTINRGTFDPDSWEHLHGPGLRAIYDLADLPASRFIVATGQSGNPLSRHYGDLLERWRDGASLQFGNRPAATLTLRPAP